MSENIEHRLANAQVLKEWETNHVTIYGEYVFETSLSPDNPKTKIEQYSIGKTLLVDFASQTVLWNFTRVTMADGQIQNHVMGLEEIRPFNVVEGALFRVASQEDVELVKSLVDKGLHEVTLRTPEEINKDLLDFVNSLKTPLDN